MTAPLALADVDWRAVLIAGMAAVYGVTAAVSGAAPLVCDCYEIDCPDGHLWVTPTTAQQRARAGDAR